MNRMRGAAALLGFTLLGGCSGDGKGVVMLGPSAPGQPTVPDQPLVRDAGLDASASSTAGPVVTLMSLVPTRDPIAGPVLTGASVNVQCNVQARSSDAPIDPTKVTVAVYGATGSDALASVPGVLQGTDLFGASVPLDKVPTGPVRFRCSATDKSTTMPLTGWMELYSFYDAGPVITFTNLNEMSVIARGTDSVADLSVQFTVAPARLSEQDLLADVAEVKLSISEREVPLAAPVGNAYTKEVDFYSFFAGAPVESVTISVSATDKRAGVPATAKKQLIVKIDGQGPVINVTSPQLSGGQPPIVGGTVGMTMTITDDLAGVATGADKLFAEILYQGVNKTYPLTALGNGSYGFTFEASQFSETSNIVAKVHAFDKAGNASIAPFSMRLDTVPPWVSLNPGNVRVVQDNPVTCSASFDPLGDSPADGDVIAQNVRVRAMVWERGIVVPGAKEIWYAGVRNDSVTLYSQDKIDVPLIINQAGEKGGRCDAINSGSNVVGTSAPFVLALGPVAPGGGRTPTNMMELSQPPSPSAASLSCDPLSIAAPADKCELAGLPYVISHTMGGHPPAVYAAAPTQGGLGCTGTSFDIAGVSGWTCLAVAARDLTGATGNLGVSTPIRVCRKLKDSDCDGKSPGDHLTPPAGMTCTDGCAMPELWTAQPGGTQLLTY